MDERRQDKCICGSSLKCIELDKDGRPEFIVCVGIGCKKKWEYHGRETDKHLMTISELKEVWS